MSLISDALKRVAEQRSGSRHPPVLPRTIAGHRPANEKNRVLFWGLAILLVGVIIGGVVYGLIQYRSEQSTPAEAGSPVPQQVIFKKISPPPGHSKSAAEEEAEPPQDLDVDQRTPLKPKVVQVAIPPESSSTEKEVKSVSSMAEDRKTEKAITTAAIEANDSSSESKDQPLQPGNKTRVGVVGLRSTEQVVAEKETVRTEEARQFAARPVRKDEPEEPSVVASIKEPTHERSGDERRLRVKTGKSGQVNLYTETTTTAVSLYRKAVSHQKARRWQEAIRAYKGVLKYEPMSAEIYNNIGVCYEKQGQLRMAAKSYEKAISINPRFYRSYNNLGIIYYQMKDFNKARAAYEQALQLNPGNSQSEINLALVYERLRRGELARRTLERVLVNDPENAEAHYNLGRMLEDQGQLDRAITHYRQFLVSNSSAYPQLRERVKERVATLEGASSNKAQGTGHKEKQNNPFLK